MDPRPQTTFIPKKPVTSLATEHKGLGFFSLIALVIFLSMFIAGVGVVLYRTALVKQVESSRQELEKSKRAFDPEFIAFAVRLNNRIEVAKQLLNKHVAISSIFEALERDTIQTVQFLDFSFTSNAVGTSNLIKVSMKGVARDYNSLAYQSQVLGANRYIKSQLFSGFNLTQEGRVGFNFEALVDPRLINYENRLSGDVFDFDNNNNEIATTTASNSSRP